MIKTISRAPYDNFSFDLLEELTNSLTCEHEVFYLWSNPPNVIQSFLSETKFTSPNIIIGIKDLLDLWDDFDFWSDNISAGILELVKMANANQEKNFVIFTSVENLKIELKRANVKNIQVVEWGGDFTNQADRYADIFPVLTKNLNSNTSYVSLNRNPRSHRLVLLGYLFGSNLSSYGYITFLGQNRALPDCILDKIPWQFEERHSQARDYILAGYKKFYNNHSLTHGQDFEIYQGCNNNADNFLNKLVNIYKNSFVEIVSETSFSAPNFLLTEKIINSVYGCNFPIILSGVGAVEHLRNVGFDMFDDIIEHSYDKKCNPLDRLISAVEDNRKLLVDVDYAKKMWLANQKRFEYNVEIAKKRLYAWYRTRAIEQFSKLSWK